MIKNRGFGLFGLQGFWEFGKAKVRKFEPKYPTNLHTFFSMKNCAGASEGQNMIL